MDVNRSNADFMRRRLFLMIGQAALIAGLVSAWLYSTFPFPQVIERLLKEDILPSPEEGFVYHAWALGPLLLVTNSLAWFPLAFAVVYFCHKRGFLVWMLQAAIVLAGGLTLVLACKVVVPVLGHCVYEGNGVWDDFHFFFAFLPRVVLGSIAVGYSYRMLKSGTREQVARTSHGIDRL